MSRGTRPDPPSLRPEPGGRRAGTAGRSGVADWSRDRGHASDQLIELRRVVIERVDELPVETPPARPLLRSVEEDLVE